MCDMICRISRFVCIFTATNNVGITSCASAMRDGSYRYKAQTKTLSVKRIKNK